MGVIKILSFFILLSFNVLAFKMEGITFNKSLENGYKEFIIHNDGTQKVRYKVKIQPSGEEDITDCIEIFPTILTIEPKSTQVLKMFGVGKEKLEEKEYPFILSFEQIVIPTLKKSNGKTVTGSSTMALAPSIQMKGYGGVIDYSQALEFKNLNFFKDDKGNLKVTGDVINNSYGSIDLGINFHNRDETILDSIGLGTVPANSSNKFTFDLNSFSSGDEVDHLEFYNDVFETLKIIQIKD